MPFNIIFIFITYIVVLWFWIYSYVTESYYYDFLSSLAEFISEVNTFLLLQSHNYFLFRF